ncbi:MAG: RagB/SusD family nutrient uptake outer membrane protein [Chitinophagaceae bacterium]|nr:RagB/SusD family nutrient uptake outer membrane protein [Chitinophagaceae bacterium]
MNTKQGIYAVFILSLLSFSCTKLNEELRSNLEEGVSGSANTAELLISAYSTLNTPYQQQSRWCLQELSTDEAIAPTRGGDWDDNGTHRAIHLHTWNADNSYMNNTYNQLGTAVFQSSNVLRNNPSAQQGAEARFIRALALLDMIDLWGVAVYREDLDNFRVDPKVMTAEEGLNFVIGEINAIMNDLPASGPAYVASKNAARVLLMKVYLNKGAFLNRENPTFAPEDMNKVIELADQVTGYTISAPGKYFDNFAPDNDVKSTENIFTLYNKEGDRGGSMSRTYNTIAHYNMKPGGWNGWATLGTFYDKFTSDDERRGINYSYPAFGRPNPSGAPNVGFLAGQQYDQTTGTPLMARNPSSQPLVFTHDITIRTSGNTLETAGIRVLKYAYDYASQSGQKNNDWVVYRYADVLLMKAEAILRGGTGGGTNALDIVNDIRSARGVPDLSSLSIDELLDERGRELYWEGWRRQDLIRFGKFLGTWVTKPEAGQPKELLFALPSQQIAVNPSLKQNPGY